MECGGKRSATPLLGPIVFGHSKAAMRSKAVSPLRFATALHIWLLSSQKSFVDGAHSLFAPFQIDHYGNLDLARGNHVDVDVVLRQRFENFSGDAGVATHANADNA